ncbi:conserved hypothetical protein [Pseudarthrobacter chlorophenolicus A6]|uniref:Uncharacterized protein n=1 Tax=Pseudarthrobacter chlorophenolicus (strain ATCC 700700 / DSM 12829 / CIP 107037 / JCM 12360 / KCTC 9906 / NCIMB 13794 / A6) TaxID=452863 RepID=B8HEX2_PSECP|nr:hypothetical protein [Pseudarthrobacter chlorophenolicus]ACL39238.1 conserved hypothetical protein [Pseudarthrobacter chlorophenolicus A6]SDR02368.1 hypothetical protein SAMN04489738_4278 [Pseudarthrobacter chlorophenolicus]
MSAWDSRRRPDPNGGASPSDPPAMFRSLCRSSPWKWQSLRFEYWDEPFDAAPAPGASLVRAWLRRPGALRLESPEGLVLHSTTGINDSRDGLYVSSTRKSWLLPPHLVSPVYGAAGLVKRRPEAAYGEPGFGNGRFSAALDPVELAGNSPAPLEFPGSNPVQVADVRTLDHEGRPAVEAVVVPTPAYQPWDPAAPLCLAGRTLVRVDLGTGVCVNSRSLELETEGYGHWLRILGVDEYMLDDLFLAESMNLTDVRRHISWDIPA